MSRAIAVEPGGLGIRADCVAPASVVGEVRPAADTPAGRTTAPEEVADAALFLASPAAEQLNGTVLRVDGGLHARLRTGPSQEQQHTTWGPGPGRERTGRPRFPGAAGPFGVRAQTRQDLTSSSSVAWS